MTATEIHSRISTLDHAIALCQLPGARARYIERRAALVAMLR